MRIVALLSWYDEPISWLAETVASASKLADHILAVDGAYSAFPGSTRRPASPTEQADVITRTAAGCGMGSTVHARRDQPWWGGEVQKRDWMFRAADLLTDPCDWLLVIDADEVLTFSPGDTRSILAESALSVGEILLEGTDGSSTLDRRLLRARRGLAVEGAHYVWTAPRENGGKDVLRGNSHLQDLAPAEMLWDVRLEHRESDRSARRKARKAEYYEQLPELERVNPT